MLVDALTHADWTPCCSGDSWHVKVGIMCRIFSNTMQVCCVEHVEGAMCVCAFGLRPCIASMRYPRAQQCVHPCSMLANVLMRGRGLSAASPLNLRSISAQSPLNLRSRASLSVGVLLAFAVGCTKLDRAPRVWTMAGMPWPQARREAA